MGENCWYNSGISNRGLEGPTVTLLAGSISQRTYAFAFQLETDAWGARESPSHACRVDGILGSLEILNTLRLQLTARNEKHKSRIPNHRRQSPQILPFLLLALFYRQRQGWWPAVPFPYPLRDITYTHE